MRRGFSTFAYMPSGWADVCAMTEPAPDPVPPVGPDQAPDYVDTEPTEDDGIQDVDQEPGYEDAESDDNNDDDDPEVHEVA